MACIRKALRLRSCGANTLSILACNIYVANKLRPFALLHNCSSISRRRRIEGQYFCQGQLAYIVASILYHSIFTSKRQYLNFRITIVAALYHQVWARSAGLGGHAVAIALVSPSYLQHAYPKPSSSSSSTLPKPNNPLQPLDTASRIFLQD